ncbi:MAG: hypothetical protein HFE76_01050 [Firmicutes bacterium]|nr:hypothetical protein [Bacillota bacterium]
MNTKKKIITVLTILVGLFVVYNAFWFCTTHWKCRQYVNPIEGMHKEFPGIYTKYGDPQEPYHYTVGFPGYLHYTGSLSINDSNGLVLIIWPKVFSKTMNFGLRLETKEDIFELPTDRNGAIQKQVYTEAEIEYLQKLLEPRRQLSKNYIKKQSNIGIFNNEKNQNCSIGNSSPNGISLHGGAEHPQFKYLSGSLL